MEGRIKFLMHGASTIIPRIFNHLHMEIIPHPDLLISKGFVLFMQLVRAVVLRKNKQNG
jgi:hypothetical protein